MSDLLKGKEIVLQSISEDKLTLDLQHKINSGGSGNYLPLSGNTIDTPVTGGIFIGPAYDAPIVFLNESGTYGAAMFWQYTGINVNGSFQKNQVEVATIDDIITKTDGDGTLFLADDGTYKAISNSSGEYLPLSGGQMEGSISFSSGYEGIYFVSGRIYDLGGVLTFEGNAGEMIINSRHSNLTIESIDNIYLKTSGGKIFYNNTEVATKADIPDPNKYVQNSNKENPHWLEVDYEHIHLHAPIELRLSGTIFLESSKVCFENLEDSQSSQYIGEEIISLMALTESGNAFKITIEDLKALLGI